MGDSAFITAAVQVLQEGILLLLLVSVPPLVAAWAAGVAAGLIAGATRLGDPVVTGVPRLLAALLALLAAGPWIGEQLLRFTVVLLEQLPRAGG